MTYYSTFILTYQNFKTYHQFNNRFTGGKSIPLNVHMNFNTHPYFKSIKIKKRETVIKEIH